jgi:hypothetical protein
MSNQVNVYGGRRNRLPYFNKVQIRRIVVLIIQLLAIYHLNNAILDMSLKMLLKSEDGFLKHLPVLYKLLKHILQDISEV